MNIPVNDDWTLTKSAFDALLAWLDPDRERAAQKYEEIRRRLIKLFAYRGCGAPEDVADRTINRVCAKLEEIGPAYRGDPVPYFYAVAKRVFLEEARPNSSVAVLPQLAKAVDSRIEDECLDECLDRLSPEDQQLILDYYRDEKQAKIDHRKALAEVLGIELNALRIKVCRIRASLKECVFECLRAKR